MLRDWAISLKHNAGENWERLSCLVVKKNELKIKMLRDWVTQSKAKRWSKEKKALLSSNKKTKNAICSAQNAQ